MNTNSEQGSEGNNMTTVQSVSVQCQSCRDYLGACSPCRDLARLLSSEWVGRPLPAGRWTWLADRQRRGAEVQPEALASALPEATARVVRASHVARGLLVLSALVLDEVRPAHPRIAVDEGASPRPGDVYIEPSAATRARLAGRAEIIDPQHGGSVVPNNRLQQDTADRPFRVPGSDELIPAAACTAAYQLGGDCRSPYGTIYVRADAGLDDYAAAAITAGLVSPCSPDVLRRLAALARADNVSWEGLPDWAPDQHLDDVTTTFPGLGRICACVPLTPQRRAELVALWLMTGDVIEPPGFARAELYVAWRQSGIPAIQVYADGGSRTPVAGPSGTTELDTIGWPSGYADPYSAPGGCLPVLDSIAVQERQASIPEVQVLHASRSIAVVSSPMRGLSAGRGAIGYGYQFAPVVVAHSPLEPTAGARCRVCGDTLATPVSSALGVADGGTPGGLGGCGDAHQWESRRLVTIAVAPNARSVRLDFSGLLAAINALELGWGGNPSSRILGSPKPGGTALSVEQIAEIVSAHVSANE